MNIKQVLFVVLLVYFSLILGIIFKLIKKGVKKRLLIRAVEVPLVLLTIGSKYVIKNFQRKDQEQNIVKRLLNALKALLFVVKVLPILVGFCGYYYSHEEYKEKEKRSL